MIDIDEFAHDPEAEMARQDEEMQQEFADYFGQLEPAQRDVEKRRLATQLAVAQETGLPLADVRGNDWPVVQAEYARWRAGRGDEAWLAAVNDEAKFGALTTERRAERRLLLGQRGEGAKAAEGTGVRYFGSVWKGGLLEAVEKSVFAGDGYSVGLAEWEKVQQGKPGYAPARRGYHEQVARTAGTHLEEVRRKAMRVVAPVSRALIAEMKAPGPDLEERMAKAFEPLKTLPPDVVGVAMQMLKEAAGSEKKWNRILLSAGFAGLEAELAAVRELYAVLDGHAGSFTHRLANLRGARDAAENARKVKINDWYRKRDALPDTPEHEEARARLNFEIEAATEFRGYFRGSRDEEDFADAVRRLLETGFRNEEKIQARLDDLEALDFKLGRHDAAVLSNGVVVVRPMLAFDAEAWAKAVHGTKATPAAKAQALARRLEMREELGPDVYDLLLRSDRFRAWALGRRGRWEMLPGTLLPVYVPEMAGQADFEERSAGELVERFWAETGGLQKALMQMESGAAGGFHGLSKDLYGALAYVGVSVEELAQESAERQRRAAGVAEGLGGATWLNKVSSGVVSLAPTLAAGPVLRGGVYMTRGAQAAKAVPEAAQFRAVLGTQGALSAGDGFVEARLAEKDGWTARGIGLLNAVPEMLITRLFGKTGVESVALKGAAVRGLGQRAEAIVKGVLAELPEELLVTGAQAPAQKLVDPDYDVAQALWDTAQVAPVLGGAVSGVAHASRSQTPVTEAFEVRVPDGSGSEIELGMTEMSQLQSGAVNEKAESAISMALNPLGVGLKAVRQAPPILEGRPNPLASVEAPTIGHWRTAWKNWIQQNREHWKGTVSTPEGLVNITNQALDHMSFVRDGEDAALHFEAAVRLKELLGNSVLTAVEAPRDYERGASEVHRRYAWMRFADGKVRNVLLTVKRMKPEIGTDADMAYSLEALEVNEIADGNSRDALSDIRADTDDLKENMHNFLAGVKPEHKESATSEVAPASSANPVKGAEADRVSTPESQPADQQSDTSTLPAQKYLTADGDIANEPPRTSLASGGRAQGAMPSGPQAEWEHHRALTKAVEQTAAGLVGASGPMSFRVLRSVEDIDDAAVREKVKLAQARGDVVEAFYEPHTKEGGPQITVMASAVSNAERASELVLHEFVGHHGLQALFKGKAEGWQRLNDQLWQQLGGATFSTAESQKLGYRSLRELAERYHDPDNGRNYNPATVEGRGHLIQEHLARLAEQDVRPTWWQGVIGKIKDLLRGLSGGTLFKDITDADVVGLLAKARRAGVKRAIPGELSFSLSEPEQRNGGSQADKKSAEGGVEKRVPGERSTGEDKSDASRNAPDDLTIDDSEKQAERTWPRGFSSEVAFREFATYFRERLKEANLPDVEPIFQGSSVTGTSFEKKLPFDHERRSDFDIALVSPTLLGKAQALGVELRSKDVRTAPFEYPEDEEVLKKLGLLQLMHELSKKAGRPVSFMIFSTEESALSRAKSIKLPQ